ncbi:hypothetical protein EV122DRAFT_275098 [Schizophyllum commune]
MSNFTLVDPKGWEFDLHSVYSAYIGYFQVHNIPWYERSWGHWFSSFEEFLAFSWPVITVTDSWTGRAHIVTRLTSIGAFIKMIKTRFGESIPQAPNILQVTPFETSTRHLRNVSDYATYKKLHATLPAAELSALKARIRAGEPHAVKKLWDQKEKTFLAMDFEWSERNERSCLEWGYAAVRCGHLDSQGRWPPVPEKNYRKGHYIVGEYVDKVMNKHFLNHPWEYAFGDSQIVSKSKLPELITSIISSLASPDSETLGNVLVVVVHGYGDIARMEDIGIKLPHNVFILDAAAYERTLYAAGVRGTMIDPMTNMPRQPGSTLAPENLLRTFAMPPLTVAEGTVVLPPPKQAQMVAFLSACPPRNAGNDAFMLLFGTQMLLDGARTEIPIILPKVRARPVSMMPAMPMAGLPAMMTGMSLGPPMAGRPALRKSATSERLQTMQPQDLIRDDGQYLSIGRSRSPGRRISSGGVHG